MGFTKDDFGKVDARLKKITEQPVEEIEFDSELPPTIEELEDNNKTYSITASILFIDIRKSTDFTEKSQAKSMVKIYRAFMRMAVDCVRKNGGVTRQFLGDRIMGVFIDSVDDNGDIIDSSVDKAINTARSLQTVIDYSLNKHLKSNVNGKTIECGIGIDYGKVLVTQVGMYGVEANEEKEDEVDCVWVGNTTNYASKYSDLASGGEIFISKNVFKNMSEVHRNCFIESAKYKGSKLFQGYVAREYYLEFSEELGKPLKIDENTTELSASGCLVEGIKEIEKLQNSLIQRERDLAVLEEKLKKENEKLKEELSQSKSEKIKAMIEKEKLEEKLNEEITSTYLFIQEIIRGSFCMNIGYIKEMGFERWRNLDEFYHRLGKKQGYSEDKINESVHYFIEIYSFFEDYEKSYKYMISMAKENSVWVYINERTFEWACKQNLGWQVINRMEENLKNGKISYGNIKKYEKTIAELKRIRGF